MMELWMLELMALFGGPYNDRTEKVYSELPFAPGRAFDQYFLEETKE